MAEKAEDKQNKKSKVNKFKTTYITEDKKYIKPPKTFTENLTKDEIKQLLIDYKQCDIHKIPRGAKVRYFIKTIENKKPVMKFRLGGIIFNNEHIDSEGYVILSNGKISWSVQVKNAIFYCEKNNDDIIEEYEDYIEQLEIDKEILIEKNKEDEYLINKNRELKEKLNNERNKNKELEQQLKIRDDDIIKLEKKNAIMLNKLNELQNIINGYKSKNLKSKL